MVNNTTLEDFCGFLENTLNIAMTPEQLELYNEGKSVALVNERNALIDAYHAGTSQFDNAAPIVYPVTAKDYVINKYGGLV